MILRLPQDYITILSSLNPVCGPSRATQLPCEGLTTQLSEQMMALGGKNPRDELRQMVTRPAAARKDKSELLQHPSEQRTAVPGLRRHHQREPV